MHAPSICKQHSLSTELDTYLRTVYASHRPGAAVLVACREEVILRAAYGIADLGLARPLTIASVFRIGSLTKQFTAAAILLLAERQQLNLQDDLRMHLPNYPAQGQGIRLEHLLNHTSGLACCTDREDFALLEPRDLSHLRYWSCFNMRPWCVNQVPGFPIAIQVTFCWAWSLRNLPVHHWPSF
jgi:CubicO group peptidase (beta-lactamase class C family)